MTQQDDAAGRDRQQGSRTPLTASFLMVAGSSYFEMATGLVRSVLVMRLLGPTGVGLTSIVLLIERYLSNAHLGVLHGMTKRLPRAVGAGDEEAMQGIEDTGVTWVVLAAAVAAVGILTAAFFYPNLQGPTRLVVAIGAAVFLCDQVYNLYRVVARSWQVYQPLVIGSVVFSLGLTGGMIIGAWTGGPVGATAGWLCASALAVLTLHRTVRLRVRPKIHWPTVKKLLLSGLPLAAMAFGDTLLLTADSTVLLRRGATVFGLYSGIALQARRYIFNLVRALSFVLMPHLLEEYSKHRSIERLRRAALTPTAALAIGVPVLAAVTAVLLPPAARTLVPKFARGVPAGQIAAFGACLMTLPLALSMCLVALDREWEAVAGRALGGLAIAILAWGPSAHGNLDGTALAAAAGALVMTLFICVDALARLGDSIWRALGTMGVMHLPLAWSVVAWLAAERFAGPLGGGAVDSWGGALLRLALYLALVSPLLVYGARRFRVGRHVRDLLKRFGRGATSEAEDKSS